MVPRFRQGHNFAVRVQGDRKQDAGIEDGDLVIVRQASEAENGEVIVALISGETTIKRFVRRGRSIWLHPENKKYRAKKIEDPSFRILGKVIGLHRYWDAY